MCYSDIVCSVVSFQWYYIWRRIFVYGINTMRPIGSWLHCMHLLLVSLAGYPSVCMSPALHLYEKIIVISTVPIAIRQHCKI